MTRFKFLSAILIWLGTSVPVFAQLQPLEMGRINNDTLKKLFEKPGFSGSILIVQHGKTVYQYSQGFADVENQKKNGDETVYNIGSIGKSITSILIMQLHEQGRINIDETIDRYLPHTNLRQAGQITLRQLLNMTAPLGDFFVFPKYDTTQCYLNADLYQMVDLPGTYVDSIGVIAYSNNCFVVLGQVLENVYGMPYKQIVQERILQPLGIEYKPAEQAKGYARQENGQYKNTNEHLHALCWSAAGGMPLRIYDLHKIMHAFVKGDLVSQKTIEQIWHQEAHPAHDPPFVYYGLGWMVEDPGGVRFRGHNGGTDGYQSAFRYLPDDDIYMYILSNHGDGADGCFFQTLFWMLKQKGAPMGR